MPKLTIRFRIPIRAVAVMTLASLFAGAAVARFATATAPVSAPEQQNQIVTVAPPTKAAATHKHRWFQLGVASWYGSQFQGRPTASGEDFDMNDMTAAHRSLPLGTLLRVTNLRNRRSVVVRVNDRGPVPEDRIIDLSYAAAQQLSFEDRGLTQVKLEVLPPTAANIARLTPPAPPQGQ